MKREMQYGKVITDERFQKPLKKRKSFSYVTSAVRESSVGLCHSFATLSFLLETMPLINLFKYHNAACGTLLD